MEIMQIIQKYNITPTNVLFESDQDFIGVKDEGGENKISILSPKEFYLSVIIELYEQYTGDKDPSKKIIYQGKQLSSTDITLKEIGYKNSEIFYVYHQSNSLLGGLNLPIKFTDIPKAIEERRKFTKIFQPWRTLIKGLNIYGNCSYSKCKIHDKTLFVPI